MPPELALDIPVASEALGLKIDQLLALGVRLAFLLPEPFDLSPKSWASGSAMTSLRLADRSDAEAECRRLANLIRRDWPGGEVRHAGYVYTLSGRGLAMVRSDDYRPGISAFSR